MHYGLFLRGWQSSSYNTRLKPFPHAGIIPDVPFLYCDSGGNVISVTKPGVLHINKVLCFPGLLRCCEPFDRRVRGQLLDLQHQDHWCEWPCAPVPREWIQCQCEREPRSRCVCWAVGCPSCPLKVLLPTLRALARSCLQGGSSLATSRGPRLWIRVNALGLQPVFVGNAMLRPLAESICKYQYPI